MVLYAFNLELSKLRETVSEPLIGRMRLQFWRDALPAIRAGEPPAHEVARPLADVVRTFDIPLGDLERMIDAREADLDDVPPADLERLADYAEGTASSVMATGLRLLGIDPAPNAELLRHAGIATCFVGLARAIPHQVASGRVTLPADLCRAADLDPSHPHQWPENPDVRPIAAVLLDAAQVHIDAVRAAGGALPSSSLPALMPFSLAALYMRRMRQCGNDPYAMAAQPIGISRPLTVLWRRVLGRP